MLQNLKMMFTLLLLAMVCATSGIAIAGELDEARAAIRQKDYTRAATLLRAQADANNAEAQYLLATMYRQGQGVGRNPKAAFNWMRRAAGLGNVQAQYAVGVMYLDGVGTAVDGAMARTWLEKAAAGGHPLAADKLAQPARHRKISEPVEREPAPIARAEPAESQPTRKSAVTGNKAGKPAAAAAPPEQAGPVDAVTAARNGQVALLRKLIREPTELDRPGSTGQTPLTAAASNDREASIRALIELGANVDALDANGDHALVIAARAGHRRSVEALLSTNTQVNTQDRRGDTAAIAAAGAGNLPLLRRLIERGADLSIANLQNCNALCNAELQRHVRIVEYLRTQRGAGPRPSMDSTAARRLADALVAESANPASPYAGWPPLCIAAWRGQTSIAAELLARGEDINGRDSEGYTPLLRAATAGHHEIVKLLLEQRAMIDVMLPDRRGVLTLAAHGGHDKVIAALLAFDDRIGQSSDAGTALIEATKAGDRTGATELLRHGAIRTPAGGAALIESVRDRNAPLADEMIRNGADIDRKDADGRTALWWAVDANWRQGVALLLDKKASVNIADSQGYTPLMQAAGHGRRELLADLLRAHADREATSRSGDTALMIAANAGHTAIVADLINSGAALDPQNSAGSTALMLAAANGHPPTVDLLLKAGADTRLINKQRLNARMLAEQGKHNAVIARFEEHARQNSLLHTLWTNVSGWF
jgi:ankyrin repeat protein